MIDTSLHSLAQNLDMPDWPIRGASETPLKYIDLEFSELKIMPGLSGRPDRIDQLYTILKETLAFDQPFGEMISEGKPAVEKDNPILKNLAKLEIPEDYPMPLVALTTETREFCALESLATLKEFALFTQSMAQTVIVGGDFRALLNALSHVDEKTLAMYLPYRPGSKGLHLIEGLALTVRAFPLEMQAALAREFGARLGLDDTARASGVARDDVAKASAALAQQSVPYLAYFQAEMAELQKQADEGVPLGRLATMLNDPLVESVVTSLLKSHLTVPAPKTAFRATTPPLEVDAQPSGFFASFRRLFKK